MKIGLLAYHSACNFGATLQLLSTFCYLKNHGHEPVVINWVPDDLDQIYQRTTAATQYAVQQQVRTSYWRETALCRDIRDVARVIEAEGIGAVIIGSDAVAQHHPWLERLMFPTRTLFSLRNKTTDTQYPNPFWAVWQDYLRHHIPVAVMSASCQDSAYSLIPPATRREMGRRVMAYDYLSVRDTWTQQMMASLTSGKRRPEVTPDPVFALAANATTMLTPAEEIRQRYDLPERYVLLSFLPAGRQAFSQQWVDRFEAEAAAAGLTAIMIPIAQGGLLMHTKKEIDLPLEPLHWHALIRHSCGYVGNNMHPIIVSLASGVPFVSFDTYGTTHLNGLLADERSSKLKHIIDAAGLSRNRYNTLGRNIQVPEPAEVLQRLAEFDASRANSFAESKLKEYQLMMSDILSRLTN